MITLYAIRYQNPYDGTTRYYRFQWDSRETDPTTLNSKCLTSDRRIADNVLAFHNQSKNKPKLLVFNAYEQKEVLEFGNHTVDMESVVTQTVKGMQKCGDGYWVSAEQGEVLQKAAGKCQPG